MLGDVIDDYQPSSEKKSLEILHFIHRISAVYKVYTKACKVSRVHMTLVNPLRYFRNRMCSSYHDITFFALIFQETWRSQNHSLPAGSSFFSGILSPVTEVCCAKLPQSEIYSVIKWTLDLSQI